MGSGENQSNVFENKTSLAWGIIRFVKDEVYELQYIVFIGAFKRHSFFLSIL